MDGHSTMSMGGPPAIFVWLWQECKWKLSLWLPPWLLSLIPPCTAKDLVLINMDTWPPSLRPIHILHQKLPSGLGVRNLAWSHLRVKTKGRGPCIASQGLKGSTGYLHGHISWALHTSTLEKDQSKASDVQDPGPWVQGWYYIPKWDDIIPSFCFLLYSFNNTIQKSLHATICSFFSFLNFLKICSFLMPVYYFMVLSSVAQSCLTLCDPMDYSLMDSSVNGIFQARILERLPFPSLGDLSNPGIKPMSLASPASAGRFFTPETPGKPHFMV